MRRSPKKKSTWHTSFKGAMIIGVIFTCSFLYLHQKIHCFVQAYQLSERYRYLKELIDKKDYLVYNLAKATTLAKVNAWSEDNDYSFAAKRNAVVLNVEEEVPASPDTIVASLFNRLLGTSADLSDALAEEKE